MGIKDSALKISGSVLKKMVEKRTAEETRMYGIFASA